METTTLTSILQCPIEDCKFHYKIIKGPLSILKNHIFRDHDYLEKLKTAVKFDLIENIQEKRSAKWLSDNLASKALERK